MMINSKIEPNFYQKKLISDQFISDVGEKIGSIHNDVKNWLEVSLIHYSYLNEKPIFERNILEVLGLLGVSYSQLVLMDIAYDDTRLDKLVDYARFVQSFAGLGETVFEEMNLGKYVLLGRGENKNSLSKSIKELIGRQFLGSLAYCYNYKDIKSFIYKIVSARSAASDLTIDYKSLLQEYVQAKGLSFPTYEVVKEYGPDNQKIFEMRVSTGDGKSATAQGSSKKDASKKAAAEYIKKYYPSILRARNSPPIAGKDLRRPLTEHLDFVNSLSEKFNSPYEKRWLFSQGLTHMSFVNEAKHKDIRDNKKLSQIGSKVLDLLFVRRLSNLATQKNISASSITQFMGYMSIENVFCEAFDLLQLDRGVLLGKGEKRDFLEIPSNKVEIFQAIIGASFRSNEVLDLFIENLPSELVDWVEEKIDILETENVKDSTSQLQEILQALKLDKKVFYEFIDTGHPPGHKAKIKISSRVTRKEIILSTETIATSRKNATRQISSLVVDAIRIINSELGVNTKNKYTQHKSLLRFAEFLLEHELSLKVGRADAAKWHSFGILGSQLLSNGKLYEFNLWAMEIERVVENSGVVNNIVRAASQFYSFIPSVADQPLHKNNIDFVRDFVNNLSPESADINLKETDGFKRIINLSKMYKLMAQDWNAFSLKRLSEDLSLLRKDRHPLVNFSNDIPEIEFYEKTGTYGTILVEILEVLEDKMFDKGVSNINIRFYFEMETSDLLIHIFVEPVFASFKSMFEEVVSEITSGILWDYLRRETPITQIELLESTLIIKTKMFTKNNSFASQILDKYKSKVLLSKAENQVSSQLLHDLKNQLVAYQVSLGKIGTDRTGILKAKYEASQHLDNALMICRSLEVVSKAMATPIIEPILIGDFIRAYIAEKIASVPLNIRFDMPKSTEASIVYTSKSFLKSILENLTKNAVEAMPNGGEIRIDWLFDEDSDLLMIDISDTGLGMGQKILEKILSGRVVDSSKHKGSGIGVLSVQSMVERLGGSSMVKSELGKGTQWSIVIPSISPLSYKEFASDEISSSNFSGNEVELQ